MALTQPDARATAVLVDELDPAPFECGPDFFNRFPATAQLTLS